MALEPDALLERARSVQPSAKQYLAQTTEAEREGAYPIAAPADDPFAGSDPTAKPWREWNPPQPSPPNSPWLKELYNQVHVARRRGSEWLQANPDPPPEKAQKAINRYLTLGHQIELLKLVVAGTVCPWPGCPVNPAAPVGSDAEAGRFRAWQMTTGLAELLITTPAGHAWHLVPYRTGHNRHELTPADLAAVIRVAQLLGWSETDLLDLLGLEGKGVPHGPSSAS
ncbi:MAG: hypothetical protein Q8R28_01195 [Dehalococcoidia bacterium]|nr:hypothetical protein [Dehalococcoidia bacterium]